MYSEEKIVNSVYPNIDYDNQYIIDTLIGNCINYALENNNTKTNYIARKLFEGVLPDEILRCFDEE